MFSRDFSMTGDAFPNSSPVHPTFDFDFALDPTASPKSTPVGGFDVMEVALDLPTADEEERLKHWLTYSDKLPTIETVQIKQKSEQRKHRKSASRKPIVMHPFASCEDTEFCVKTLTAFMNGSPLPLTVEQELQRAAARATFV